jgi:hypothetical protein
VVFGSVRYATNRSGNGGRLALLALFAVLLFVFYSTWACSRRPGGQQGSTVFNTEEE